MKRSLVVSLFLALLAACAGNGAALDTTPQKSDVDAMRDEAYGVWKQQQLLLWDEWTQGTPANLAETFRDHETLFSSRTAWRLLRSMNENSDPAFQRSVRYLRRHILFEVVGYETSAQQDELARVRNAESLKVGDQTFALSHLNTLMARETDYARRRELQQAAGQTYANLSEAHLQLDRAVAAATKKLGFSSYLELANELRGTDLAEVSRVAEQFMNDTDPIFLAPLKQALMTELSFEFEQMRHADMPRLLWSVRYDKAFPQDILSTSHAVSMRQLGFSLADMPNLRIDADARANKRKRPRTFPVAVPNDVRMSYLPQEGLRGWEALYHEAGHALFYVTSRAPSFELQALGDQTLVYAYGFLMQSILGNPHWVKTALVRLTADEQKSYSKYIALKRLFLARRYAAKVMFEVAWHSNQQPDLAKLYQNLMSRAHGFRLDEVDAQRWLVDHEPFFLSAQFFRAWLLAGLMEQRLQQTFGDRWFESKEAGAWIAAFMRKGLEPSVDELARDLGVQKIDGKALIAVLKPRL
ncbi:MAG: hypothetical protein IT381_14395 [Deltaproteobacteria bacterium]|nr:hypothetical protein [Deltaproteobacteria bacterium]